MYLYYLHFALTRMTAPHDLAKLLVTTGFSDITVDVEEYCVVYPSLMSILKDLQLLGESNALICRYRIF